MKTIVYNVTSQCPEGDFGSSFERGFHEALVSTEVQVKTGLDHFIHPTSEADLLFLHWPEWIQQNLQLSLNTFLSLISTWKNHKVKVGIVIHNSTPHLPNGENIELYNRLKGSFDFAIHFEEYSRNALNNWAKRHYLVPHPLMNLPKPMTVSAAKQKGILVLGHIRNRSEYTLILKFAFVARLLGLKMYVGRFHDFKNQQLLLNRLAHHFIWGVALGAKTIRGHVGDEILRQWVENCKYSLMFRSEAHLNSAIPYTAVSNGLIPIGLAYCNSKDFMQRMKIPHLDGSGFIEMIRYVFKLKQMTFELIPLEASRMKIEHVGDALSAVISSELK